MCQEFALRNLANSGKLLTSVLSDEELRPCHWQELARRLAPAFVGL